MQRKWIFSKNSQDDIAQNDNDHELHSSRHYYCNTCGRWSVNFEPWGIDDDFFKKHHVIGGGQRLHAVCPRCKSTDRSRWFWYILKHKTDILSKERTILHITPEYQISENIVKHMKPGTKYICGDIDNQYVSYIDLQQIDVTNLSCFEDHSFDYIIMNHVLEHVINEKMAMMEIRRCLKENGRLLISFPICPDMLTLEDKSITTDEERLKHYGQTDHYRLYGRDADERIRSYGFHVERYVCRDHLPALCRRLLALISDDVVFVSTPIE